MILSPLQFWDKALFCIALLRTGMVNIVKLLRYQTLHFIVQFSDMAQTLDAQSPIICINYAN